MPSITIHIAAPTAAAGTTGITSLTRLMWLELDDGHANADSISSHVWRPRTAATQSGPGILATSGQALELRKSYSRTLHISASQYQKIKAFATNPVAHGMAPAYDILNNNSISFVWRALQAAGLSAADSDGARRPAARRINTGAVLDDTDTADTASAHAEHTESRQASTRDFLSDLLQQSQALVCSNWKSTMMNRLHKHLAEQWQERADDYDRARIVRYDPLALDLDGDGLETCSVTSANPVYFDHDGDGIRTATGWIAPDDGLLVLDRNNNGIIDDGSELFGDNTTLRSGSVARDGFAALAEQDSNQDGVVDRDDAGWNQLRIWRDLNQDGESQHAELFSPEQLDITSLALDATPQRRALSNGNQIADTGHYTRRDGSRGEMADINFRERPFFRRFTDTPAISDAVMRLPEVAGSGKVRDLRAAAMQSPALHATLTQYRDSTTSSGQRSLLEQLLAEWAATAGMSARLQDRLGGRYRIEWRTLGRDIVHNDARGKALVTALEKKLAILDAFNGRHFFEVRNGTPVAFAGFHVREQPDRAGVITIALSPQQLDVLERSYAVLHDTVYGSLLLQTRFQTLFGQVNTSLADNRVQMDFSAIEDYFEQALAANRLDAMAELIEFYQYANLAGLPQWRADVMLARQIHQRTGAPAEQQLFAQNGISRDQRYEWKNNIIIGSIAGEWVFGSYQNDLIYGDAGNDELYGFNNDDLLDGGGGDDYLKGGSGNDIYLLRRNAGHDVIDNTDSEFGLATCKSSRSSDIVVFEDLVIGDLQTIRRDGNDMQLAYGGTDSVTIKNVFVAPDCEIDAFHFADNVVLTTAQLLNEVMLEATRLGAADDVVQLSRYDEFLFAGDGRDTIDGGAGDDCLSGENGDDLLFGNGGEDLLDGGGGNDLLIGGRGNDIIHADDGADVIAFNRGDGADTIRMSAAATGNTVSLGGGIRYSDLLFKKNDLHLILDLGSGDTMTFRDWYADDAQTGVAWLQMMTENGRDYDSRAVSPLHNKKIVQLDFSRLVAQFDAARTADPDLGRWTPSAALQQVHHTGSDVQALGGERAYHYARQLPFLMPASTPGLPQPAPPQAAAGNFAMTTM